jgi:hypothetical protein
MNEENQAHETQKVPVWILLIVVVMLVGFIALVWFKEAGSDIANWIMTAMGVTTFVVAFFGLGEVEDNERFAIFFLGQFYKVKGPPFS